MKVIRRLRYRYDTLGWRGDAHRHLFLIDVAEGEARQLTHGDWDDLSPIWSPDGRSIAFISGRRPERDMRAYTEAYVVPVSGGDPVCWSGDLYSIGALTWSPDSSRLVAVASDDPTGNAGYQGWLFVLESGHAPRRITDDALRPATGFYPIMSAPELRWTADGRILLIGDVRGESYLYELPAGGGPARPIAGGGFQATALSCDREARRVVLAATPPDFPGALYLVETSEWPPEALDRRQSRLLLAAPAGASGKIHLSAPRAGDRMPSVVTTGIRPAPALSPRARHPRRPQLRLL